MNALCRKWLQVLTASVTKAGDDEGRTAYAAQIEAEDAALEARKLKPCCCIS